MGEMVWMVISQLKSMIRMCMIALQSPSIPIDSRSSAAGIIGLWKLSVSTPY